MRAVDEDADDRREFVDIINKPTEAKDVRDGKVEDDTTKSSDVEESRRSFDTLASTQDGENGEGESKYEHVPGNIDCRLLVVCRL